MAEEHAHERTVLVTAASGYTGSRLLAALAEDAARTGPAPADALDPAAVRASLESVDTAFYLVHTLGMRTARSRSCATVATSTRA